MRRRLGPMHHHPPSGALPSSSTASAPARPPSSVVRLLWKLRRLPVARLQSTTTCTQLHVVPLRQRLQWTVALPSHVGGLTASLARRPTVQSKHQPLYRPCPAMAWIPHQPLLCLQTLPAAATWIVMRQVTVRLVIIICRRLFRRRRRRTLKTQVCLNILKYVLLTFILSLTPLILLLLLTWLLLTT